MPLPVSFEMMIMDLYAVFCFVAILIIFVLFFYNLQRKSRVGCIPMKNDRTNSNGCWMESGADVEVMIVGAGVAGAALAYALGKVHSVIEE